MNTTPILSLLPFTRVHTNEWIPARRTVCTGTDLRVIKGSSSCFLVTAVSVSSITTSKCNLLHPPCQANLIVLPTALQVFSLPQHLCRLKQEFCCKMIQELLCNVFSVFVTPSTSPVPGTRVLGNPKTSLSLPIPPFPSLTTPVTPKGSLPLLERSFVHPPELQWNLQPIFCKLLFLSWKNSQEQDLRLDPAPKQQAIPRTGRFTACPCSQPKRSTCEHMEGWIEISARWARLCPSLHHCSGRVDFQQKAGGTSELYGSIFHLQNGNELHTWALKPYVEEKAAKCQ